VCPSVKKKLGERRKQGIKWMTEKKFIFAVHSERVEAMTGTLDPWNCLLDFWEEADL
jgi:hypothetical protein